jgi:hypothetical protein
MISIVSPEERLAEPLGARILLLGPNGAGKTTQARLLDSGATLFIDSENGSLAIADVRMSHCRIETWQEFCDLIVRIVGPNRSFAPHENFSHAHFDRVGGYLPGWERFQTFFVDTVTAMIRLCFRWALAQPEVITERGKLDLRSVYGLLARTVLLALHHLQSARGKNVILVGALETVTDDYGRTEHRLQAEGQRIAREILGIVDIVVTMNFIDFDDGKPTRAFVCTSPNPWHFPGKDRSGKLEMVEPPDLGALIAKILPPRASVGGAAGQSQSTIIPFDPQQEGENT